MLDTDIIDTTTTPAESDPAIIRLLDREAVALVLLDAPGAVRLAMLASELRAALAREAAL